MAVFTLCVSYDGLFSGAEIPFFLTLVSTSFMLLQFWEAFSQLQRGQRNFALTRPVICTTCPKSSC